MTSRERVSATLRHEEPDKVPIDLGAMGSTGIMAIAYNKLKNELGLSEKTTLICDLNQQLAEPEKAVLDYFEIDVISLENSFNKLSEEWTGWYLPDGSYANVRKNKMPIKNGDDWIIKDGDRIKSRMIPSSLYFESCNPILENAEKENDLNIYTGSYLTDEQLLKLEKKAKWLNEETDYAIMGGFGGSIVEEAENLRGWSNFMIDLLEKPDFAESLMQKILDTHLKNIEGYLQAVGPYIQIIQMGDDLGAQNGPQISSDLYKSLVKPYHQKLYKYVKSNSDLYLFMHSCGSIYDLIPDFIDSGVDIINPVQFSAAQMDSKQLKSEFGNKISFWGGGIDTQQLLPFGKPEEIACQVEEQINIFSPGGGYVFAAVHNIQANIPVENIMAVYNTAKNVRNYPRGIYQ